MPCVPLRTRLAYQAFIPLTLRNLDQEEDWYAGTQIWDSRARGCDARMRYERAPPEVASWGAGKKRVTNPKRA
jgi:hypothetical protein